MTSIVRKLRRVVHKDCLVEGTLLKNGCQVKMDGVPEPKATLDFDHKKSPLGADDLRCDYLVVAESKDRVDWIVPVEIKSGKLEDADHAVRQLRAGLSVIDGSAVGAGGIRLRPVIAHGRKTHRNQRKKLKLRKNRIDFHGASRYAKLIRCGSKLASVLR